MRHETEKLYQVIVANVGNVHSGTRIRVATDIYLYYVSQSKRGIGRVAGEDVVLFKGNEIMCEYLAPEIPSLKMA